mgnify:CR=1 FL=1
MQTFNCIICAQEIIQESKKIAGVNHTIFKICEKCCERSNPEQDYKEAKDLINSYVVFACEKSMIKS